MCVLYDRPSRRTAKRPGKRPSGFPGRAVARRHGRRPPQAAQEPHRRRLRTPRGKRARAGPPPSSSCSPSPSSPSRCSAHGSRCTVRERPRRPVPAASRRCARWSSPACVPVGEVFAGVAGRAGSPGARTRADASPAGWPARAPRASWRRRYSRPDRVHRQHDPELRGGELRPVGDAGGDQGVGEQEEQSAEPRPPSRPQCAEGHRGQQQAVAGHRDPQFGRQVRPQQRDGGRPGDGVRRAGRPDPAPPSVGGRPVAGGQHQVADVSGGERAHAQRGRRCRRRAGGGCRRRSRTAARRPAAGVRRAAATARRAAASAAGLVRWRRCPRRPRRRHRCPRPRRSAGRRGGRRR